MQTFQPTCRFFNYLTVSLPPNPRSRVSKIEERLERVSPNQRPVLPSELLGRKQLYFQCGEEVTTKLDVELLGDDCLLWASDFPHEATRTDMKKLVKQHFVRKDLSREAKKKIIYDNAKRFYRL